MTLENCGEIRENNAYHEHSDNKKSGQDGERHVNHIPLCLFLVLPELFFFFGRKCCGGLGWETGFLGGED
jgi:hypothetical protein